MPYADRADVEALMAQFAIGAYTKPSGPQVDAIIAATSNELDAWLSGAGVTVPVTEPAYFLGWLSSVNAYGAVAAVLKSMFPDSVGPGETPAWAFWESRYKAALKGISDGSMLSGAILGTAGRITPSNYFTRNSGDEEEVLGSIAEPFFKRGMQF
jgi:hypothetical protein